MKSFLPFLVPLYTPVLAQPSLRGMSAIEGRQLQGKSALKKPCTLFQRIVDFEDGRKQTGWDCLLDPEDGDVFVEVTDVDLVNATSGETTLFAPGLTIAQEKANIPDQSQAVFGHTRRHRDRRLAAAPNDMKVIAVRVTCQNLRVGDKLDTIKTKIFDDASNLKVNMEQCSAGKTTVNRGAYDGGIDVSISNCDNQSMARNEAMNAISTIRAENPDTYFMYCLPAGLPDWGIAYAYINSFTSVYNDDWCGYPSVQMHEIGHNLGVAHASEGTDTYGDQTGFMGYSYSKDTQNMCFNAANMYQLGWFDEAKVKTFGVSTPPSGTILLDGHVNHFGNGFQAIRLVDLPIAGEDTYIWFNEAVGMNSNTIEAKNMVAIATRGTGTGYSQSYLQAKVGAGANYKSPGGKDSYTLEVVAIGDGKATVSFGGGTPAPTPSPSAAPIGIPSASPTAAPTASPSAAPIGSPSASPTAAPTASPSAAPIGTPTSSPTDTPTSMPSVAPSPGPVTCENVTDKDLCNFATGCSWTGNPKWGSCGTTTTDPNPNPTPAPAPGPDDNNNTSCPSNAKNAKQCPSPCTWSQATKQCTA